MIVQANNLLTLGSDDLEEWQTSEIKTFQKKELYGHINGGAEIFYEYGFEQLIWQKIKKENLEIQIEIYEMIDPISAFGIFSISHHKKTLKENPIIFWSFNQYQIALVCGKYYITITNYDGSEIAQDKSKKIANKLIEKIQDPNVILPSPFYYDSLRASINNLIFLKGKIGLQSGYPQGIELLNGMNFSSLFLMPVESMEKEHNIILLTLSETADLKILYKKLNVDGQTNAGSDWLKGNYKEKIIYIKQKNPTELLLIQSSELINKPEKILDFLNLNN